MCPNERKAELIINDASILIRIKLLSGNYVQTKQATYKIISNKYPFNV